MAPTCTTRQINALFSILISLYPCPLAGAIVFALCLVLVISMLPVIHCAFVWYRTYSLGLPQEEEISSMREDDLSSKDGTGRSLEQILLEVWCLFLAIILLSV